MSTYYYFHCAKHQVSGGCWTRQAWGWGNADLVDAFKFVMYHVSECGPESIGMHSEHEDYEYTPTSYDTEGGERRQHLEQTAHIFPRSDDWTFMENHPQGFKEAWVQEQLRELDT